MTANTDTSNTPPIASKIVIGASSGTNWIVYPPTNLLVSNVATIYKSPDTGLRGVAIETGEPLCSLHVVIATESNTNSYSHKDDGLPHTLEHAIFLGSEKYPYKGILDKLANRSLANGTNAWTATDHTAYTLTTAGEEGALNLLPIYADHILYPTLSDESFLTEVHHVTKEGKDKGVVYCEMQGRENSDGSLVDRALMDLLYPNNCGYSSETGGKLKNLRKLNNSQVRRYHAENYTPDNVMFVLSGNLIPDDFLNALDKVEHNIKSKPTIPKIQNRPWMGPQSIVSPLDMQAVGVNPPVNSSPSSVENFKPYQLEFPSEEESRATISMGWRGPNFDDRKTWILLQLLWEYLSDSAASPLEKAFVECEEPVCAGIYPAHEIFTCGYHQVWFNEVDIEKIDTIIPKFFDTIIDAKKSIDMDRMNMVIRLQRRKLLEFSERKPTQAIVDGVVRNFLYSAREEEGISMEQEIEFFKLDADSLSIMEDALTTMQRKDWEDLLEEYVLNRPYAVVYGKPSAKLAKKMAEDEIAREEQQAKELGPEKLQQLGDELSKAMAFNEREIPQDILKSVNVPSLDNVKPVPILTIRGVGENVDIATNSGQGIPEDEASSVLSKLRESAKKSTSMDANVNAYYVDWNHFESAFLTVAVGVSTKSLSTKQRLYLPTLLDLAFKLPATLDDGVTKLTKDELVSQVQNDTVSYGAYPGLLGGRISQMISYKVQLENSDDDGSGFVNALKWIRRILYNTTLSIENVKMTIQKSLSEIPTQIRDGPTVCHAISAELNFDPEVSNAVAMTPLRQWPFLEQLVKKMESGTEEANNVVQELEDIRKELIQQENMQIFVAGNLLKIPDPMTTLAKSLEPPANSRFSRTENGKMSVVTGKLLTGVSAVTVVKRDSINQAVIGSLSAIESSFLGITSPGVGSYDPNQASLLVAIEYLTALEGDFWVKLRGAGLTYGSSIYNTTESKMLKFGLFKCADVIGAYEASSQIIVDYASYKSKISPIGLESSKSSLAYSIIAGTSTRLNAAINAWTQNYEGRKVDYNQWLLKKISNVTEQDVIHALVTYLVPIFDPNSNIEITCPTNKAKEIGDYFIGRGWKNLRIITEDKLSTAFSNTGKEEENQTEDGNKEAETKEQGEKKEIPKAPIGVSMFMPGAFAAQFKCACPKCDI